MLTIASAMRSSRSASGTPAPGSISRRTSAPIPSISSTARPLPSINKPAVIPRSSCGTLSSPCGENSLGFCTAIDSFLDPREIDDALAQHRLAHLAEFEVLLLCAVALGRGGRQDEAHQLIVQ